MFDRHAKLPREVGCLIEAALVQTPPVEWNRHDEIRVCEQRHARSRHQS